MRSIADSFVVAPPKALNTATRLRTTTRDHDVLVEVGLCLGQLKCKDWVRLLAQQQTVAERKDRVSAASTKEDKNLQKAELKRVRKVFKRDRRAWLTKLTTARWADTIIKANDQQLRLSTDNLYADRRSLRAAIRTLEGRVAAPVGAKNKHGTRGYATKHERAMKQQRLDHKRARLVETQRQIDTHHPSVQFGGKDLARKRKSITDEAELEDWGAARLAERMFVKAMGDKNAGFGNQTIRYNPATGLLSLRLPNVLAHLSNTPGATPRYEFENPLKWHHRGDELDALVYSSAVQYEIFYECDKQSWYVRATWQIDPNDAPIPDLEKLATQRTLAVDLNYDHLACYVVDECGNFVGSPISVPISTAGGSKQRLGQLLEALSTVWDHAEIRDCASLTIEDLNFADARAVGKETMGRGSKGKAFRRKVAGIPTGKVRNYTTCMAYNRGKGLIAVDPAYTSKHGKKHWLGPMQNTHKGKHATGHHGACAAIGRRGKGFKARRRTGAVAVTQRNIRDEQSSSQPRRYAEPDGRISSGSVLTLDGDTKRVGASASWVEKARFFSVWV